MVHKIIVYHSIGGCDELEYGVLKAAGPTACLDKALCCYFSFLFPCHQLAQCCWMPNCTQAKLSAEKGQEPSPLSTIMVSEDWPRWGLCLQRDNSPSKNHIEEENYAGGVVKLLDKINHGLVQRQVLHSTRMPPPLFIMQPCSYAPGKTLHFSPSLEHMPFMLVEPATGSTAG